MASTTDFLVIGTGIAGYSAALKCARAGSVAIITKKSNSESNTNYAQGGIASVISPNDSFEMHVQDTLKAGAGLCRLDAVELIVKNGPSAINELTEIGVHFTKTDGRLDLGREGGHSQHRIVHAQDLTGREIERALIEAVKSNPNIQVFENHIALEVITEHHLRKKITEPDIVHCFGAYALDIQNNIVKKFLSKITILASGGCGQVYKHTTNPKIATGDGIAMAYRAGARVGNLEFMQFHPTSLYHPEAQSFLISEAVRGFGAYLTNAAGERFMERYSPQKELAPRDIVARAIDAEMKKRGEACVFLDLRHLDAHKTIEHFPHIYKNCLKFKIDITKEPVPVVPAAHYMCGGVQTNLDGQTDIHRLYACGEVALTGVHGANRLASNSLLEAVVFANQVYEHASKLLTTEKLDIPEFPEWDESGTFSSEEWILIEHNREEIQQIMWDYVGIVRSNLRLERAERRIQLISDEIENFYKGTKVTEALIELRNLAKLAKLIIRCAKIRKESRGLHYTTDYIQTDDVHGLNDTVIRTF
ncbi:L-aspartate oxidase [bacterium]|nr:L-aspartate oxidase [bacterium]